MRKEKAELLKKIHGGQVCQLIATTTRLGFFDILAPKPLSIDSIAIKLSLSREMCTKLIYSLEAMDLVHTDDEALFSLTEQGLYLSKNHDDSLQDIAIYKGAKTVWFALGHLYEGIINNDSPFERAFGKTIFDYLEENEEEFIIFHKAMRMYEQKSSKKILDRYSFEQFATIADIGGGWGTFLLEILKKSPSSKGLVYDLPKVIEHAKEEFRLLKSSLNMQFQAGSFFTYIPPHFDAYLLRNILHNWSDEKALEILANIKANMKCDSKLLIFETIIEENAQKRLGKFSNLNMFVLTPGGKERTKSEIASLIDRSGLQLKQIIQTTGSKALIEVTL